MLIFKQRRTTHTRASSHPCPSDQTRETSSDQAKRCISDNGWALRGRLSNPDETVETLAGQGSRASKGSRNTLDEGPKRASDPSEDAVPGERGRLSNPVQRRLSRAEIEQLIDHYRGGVSIDGLARLYEVHRTTVIHHLDRAGVARRRVVRTMTDESVAMAAARYKPGASLAVVASEFGVHQRTLARELRRAGASIRARRGRARS